MVSGLAMPLANWTGLVTGNEIKIGGERQKMGKVQDSILEPFGVVPDETRDWEEKECDMSRNIDFVMEMKEAILGAIMIQILSNI